MSNITDLTTNDIVDKYKALKLQNKELKALLIEKDNKLNELKRDNITKNDEIQKMIDPIGGKSVLKSVSIPKPNPPTTEIQERAPKKERQDQRPRKRNPPADPRKQEFHQREQTVRVRAG